ncbi:MAG: protease inhibitor I42 family protein [bacterium]
MKRFWILVLVSLLSLPCAAQELGFEPTPEWTYQLDSAQEFAEFPGGFGNALPGAVFVGGIPVGEGFTDGQGAQIITAPGQVELLVFPTLDVGEDMVLIRVSVQSTGGGAAVALAALDGSMDGSIATNIPANSAVFLDEYDRMVLVYDPPGTTIMPVVQVANQPGQQDVSVYLDNLEIYLLPRDVSIPSNLLYGESAAPEDLQTPTPVPTPRQQVIVGTDQEDTSVEVYQGDWITVRLPENHSTGYFWEIEPIESQAVVLQESDYIEDLAPEGMTGVGGTRIFVFKAEAPGTAEVRMSLKCAWMEEPADLFHVTIRVEAMEPTPIITPSPTPTSHNVPDIYIETLTLEFEEGDNPKIFIIENKGYVPLSVSSISLDAPAPWIYWSPQATFDVQWQQEVNVSIDWSQVPAGETTRRLLVESNDFAHRSPYPDGVYIVTRKGDSPTPVPTITPTPEPLPADVQGLWQFTLTVQQPVQQTWEVEGEIGENGAIVLGGEFEGANVSYAFDPETNTFTLHIENLSMDLSSLGLGSATVTLDATGAVNDDRTQIDGTVSGSGELVVQTPIGPQTVTQPVSGVFHAEKLAS